MKCPICGSRNTGKIKSKHFFCRECYCEMEEKNGELIVYTIDADGTVKEIAKTA